MGLGIKKEDTVLVIAGREKGKRGRVLSVDRSKGKILVEQTNLVKKHMKPNPQAGVAGGIVEQEAPIQASNVAIFNPGSNKADRVGFKVEGDSKVRIFKSNGEAIDS